MTHKNRPDTHCPLTGKLCPKIKSLKITELNEGNSSSFGCCESCSAQWAEQFSDKSFTPIAKLDGLNLPAAIKELADFVFGPPTKTQLPKITVSHDLPIKDVVITPKLLQEAAERVAKKKQAGLTCPGCKTTLEDMTNADRLGCAQCYDTFARYIEPLLVNCHGSLIHKGKTPKNQEIREIEELFSSRDVLKFKIASLNDEKRDAISKERYERAGEIVEEIENLQLELLDLSEASLESECPSSAEDYSSQTDQLPPQKDEDQ